MTLACARSVYSILENPLTSSLDKAPCIEVALSAVGAHRIVTYLGGFGAPSLKPLFLASTHIPAIATRLLKVECRVAKRRLQTRAAGTHQRLFEDTPRINNGKRTRAGSSSSTGWRSTVWVCGRGQKASAVYPTEFCNAVCALVLESVACRQHGQDAL